MRTQISVLVDAPDEVSPVDIAAALQEVLGKEPIPYDRAGRIYFQNDNCIGYVEKNGKSVLHQLNAIDALA